MVRRVLSGNCLEGIIMFVFLGTSISYTAVFCVLYLPYICLYAGNVNTPHGIPTLILPCAAIDGLQFELKDDRDTQQYIVQVKAWSCNLVFIDCMEAWV